MYKNVIIKISGEALAGNSGSSHDPGTVNGLIDQIVRVKKAGTGVAIVCGGGNIWRGRDDTGPIHKAASHQMGMLASVMNGIYLSQMMAGHGIIGRVMTPFEIGGFGELYQRDKAMIAMKEGHVPIFAGGSGLPYFSTDTVSVVRGAELCCDCLIFTKEFRKTAPDGSAFSGVYDSDPCQNPSAKKFDRLSAGDVLKLGLNAVDLAASSVFCGPDVNLSIRLINIAAKDAIVNAATLSDDEFIKMGTIINK